MKLLHLLLATCLLLLPASGRSAEEPYGYPVEGSYEATIMGTPDALRPELPKSIPTKKLILHPRGNLNTPGVFFYDQGLRCTLAYQEERAPLVFLIAGTGAGHNAAKMVFLTRAQGGMGEISRRSWLFLILSGLATGASWMCYYRALQLGRASQVVPIDKLSVVITLVLAFVFLHEPFTAKSMVGCALVAAGTLFMVL